VTLAVVHWLYHRSLAGFPWRCSSWSAFWNTLLFSGIFSIPFR